jgi:hypothetical protein
VFGICRFVIVIACAPDTRISFIWENIFYFHKVSMFNHINNINTDNQ